MYACVCGCVGLWKGGGGGGSVCGVFVHLNLCCLNICKRVCKHLVPATLCAPSHSAINVMRT